MPVAGLRTAVPSVRSFMRHAFPGGPDINLEQTYPAPYSERKRIHLHLRSLLPETRSPSIRDEYPNIDDRAKPRHRHNEPQSLEFVTGTRFSVDPGRCATIRLCVLAFTSIDRPRISVASGRDFYLLYMLVSGCVSPRIGTATLPRSMRSMPHIRSIRYMHKHLVI